MSFDPLVSEVEPELQESRAPSPYLCTREQVAFDLSQLQPTDLTPPAFWFAWLYVQQTAERALGTPVPGFVLALSGTVTGPTVRGRVGAVRMASPGLLSFMTRLPPTEIEDMIQDPSNPFRVSGSFGRSPFMTAFGTQSAREGFFVSNVQVEGTLDSTCSTLRDVRVTMLLPKQNAEQRFGNMTVGEALGPATTDTDGDGAADSWTVVMKAASLEALTIRP